MFKIAPYIINMLMNGTIAVLLTAIVGIETLAQAMIENGLKHKRDLFIGLVLYVIVGTIYYFMLRNGSKMAIANALWNAGTSVGVALVGWIMFGQKLQWPFEISGLALIVVGVFLMGMTK